MDLPLDDVRRLEEIAANAVPARTVQLVDGWWLRAWPEAPFRRSNSVLPIRGEASRLEERISLVRDFYAGRGLPVRYQLSPAALPEGLDDRLAARGYAVEAPVLVRLAESEVVLARTAGASPGRVAVAESPDARWLATYAGAHGDDAHERSRLEAYGRLLDRLGPRLAAATLEVDGLGPAAVAFAVVERGFSGVFGMGTRPEARGRGAGRALLHALAQAALAAGAARMYLQVEADNAPALALYDRAGFAPGYGYHYRTLRWRMTS